jgi:hypothetical protein
VDTAVPTHKTVHIKRLTLPRRLRDELARMPRSSFALIAAGLAMLYMVNLREAHFGEVLQLVSGWACVMLMLTIGRFPATRRNAWRLVFVLVAAYLTLRYLWWRSFETLIYTNPADFVGMSLLFGAEVYSITLHLLGLFVNAWPLDREPVDMPKDRMTWPTVDVLIPTYNEDPDIVKLTALAATQIDYPRHLLRVYICDDGGTMEKRAHPERGDAVWQRRYRLKEIATEVGATYITRETNRSAKAGNLNHALQHTKGDFVLFLDCDHVPDGGDPAAHAGLSHRGPQGLPGADAALLRERGAGRDRHGRRRAGARRERDVLSRHPARPRLVGRQLLLRLGGGDAAHAPHGSGRHVGPVHHRGRGDRVRAAPARLSQRLREPPDGVRPRGRELRRLHAAAHALGAGHGADLHPARPAVRAGLVARAAPVLLQLLPLLVLRRGAR